MPWVRKPERGSPHRFYKWPLYGALYMMAIGVLVRALMIGFLLREPLYWGGPFDALQECALGGAFMGLLAALTYEPKRPERRYNIEDDEETADTAEQ